MNVLTIDPYPSPVLVVLLMNPPVLVVLLMNPLSWLSGPAGEAEAGDGPGSRAAVWYCPGCHHPRGGPCPVRGGPGG